MKKRILTLMLGLTMTVSALAGCSSSADSTEAAPAEEKAGNTQETAAKENISADKVTADAGGEKASIRVLSAMQIVDEEMMQEFMDANPDITVEFEYVDSGNYSAKFAALASASELPDVFWTQTGYYCDQIKEGLLMDLSDAMASNSYEGDKAWKDTFIPNLLTNFENIALSGCGEMESYDYGVPFTMTTVAVMYDKKI